MSYIPHTEEDRRAMLATIGVESIAKLFSDIPEALQLKEPLDVPPALDPHSILRTLAEYSRQNRSLDEMVSFLGAGVYQHAVPSAVAALIGRGEFLSAYTPYQPEASQGYLQTIYEFQTMICELTGMEVANASMYDGATAAAEAAVMAHGVTGKDKIVVSRALHPHYRECIRTYAAAVGCTIVEPPLPLGEGRDEGTTGVRDSAGVREIRELEAAIDKETACVVWQYPDFFGRVLSPLHLVNKAREVGALTVCATEPVSLGVLRPPGSFGVDVVVGEGQPLGVPMGYGGPHVGFFCVKRDLVRAIPGRIVGATHDKDGRRGFVMTLRTREQDIRREKATSNICTNQALMALAATIYMSLLGKQGFREVAEACVRNAHYCAEQLLRIPGVSLLFPDDPFAFEFAVRLPKGAEAVRDALLDQDILAGLPLGRFYPPLPLGEGRGEGTTGVSDSDPLSLWERAGVRDCLLVAVTEVRTRAEIDNFAT
ncbi:MAG: aminomethyl-transferring glycine dehydrogenase, partial [Armatimonadota bacterium]